VEYGPYDPAVRVGITLLGGFVVSLDGDVVPSDRWHRRQAAALVKVLALAPRGRLHRDRLVDVLWPEITLEVAVPRLHKAAHFARQALGFREAVVLKDETVSLFPGAELEVDALTFEAAAEAALSDGSTEACLSATQLYRGELLPDDLSEAWTDEPRTRLRSRYEMLLRGARRWSDLLTLEPADEEAHVELLREAVTAGERATALRRYEEMERVLERELGVAPSPEAVALRERVLARTKSNDTPARPAAARPVVGPAQTLLERDDELAALSRTVRSVLRTGRGTVVVMTGEAGSGKSSLMHALLGTLDNEMVVAMGGCDDLLAPRSLGPFRDMAEAHPGLASALSGAVHHDDLLPALLRFVAAAPTIVVVEDVHWADDATLDAIRYLSRRIPGVPAILLLTFRDEEIEATHPLRRILGGLNSSSQRRIELAPLSVDAIRRLSGVDADEAAEIHRITRGNPFFVTEILDAGAESVPVTVRDAVLGRVSRLPAPVRRLTERVAVIPSRAERWLVESLGDTEALVIAERSGVLSGTGGFVAFRHELARRAIEASLTVGELVQANREVLDILLQQTPIEPARIVHHAVRALSPDSLVRYGPVAAADAQRAGAHRQAAETARLVLEHADLLDVVAQARLQTLRAYSLYVVNEYRAALSCATSAIDLAEASGDSMVLADALMTMSRIAFFASGPSRARAAAARAVRVLEPTGDDNRLAAALIELARAHGNLATAGVVAQPSAETVAFAERALDLCTRLGRDDLGAQALGYRGSGRLALGDLGGFADIERALALGAIETRLETRVRGYVNAAGSAYRAGRMLDAERHVAAGLRLAADGEFAAGEYRLHLTAAAVAASTGQWDRAIAGLRDVLARPGQPGAMGPLARSLLARLLARRGDPAATGVLDAALRDWASSEDSFVAGPLAVAQVELAWLSATLDDVPTSVLAAVDLAARSGHTAMHAELCAYLRRAGHEVAGPAEPPGPWEPTLAGQAEAAAAAWLELGDRYEHAVELALSGGDRTATGIAVLNELGATATIARLHRP
jgi:DNA-binding SARP family transcriptional activator